MPIVSADGRILKYFHRMIAVRAQGNHVSADLEDDFHRFGVDIVHDGEKIISAAGREIRTPWNNCRSAGAALTAFVGKSLEAHPWVFSREADIFAQCTHMHELVTLAASHVARRADFPEIYLARAEHPDGDRLHAELYRNGTRVLWWNLERRRTDHLSNVQSDRLSALGAVDKITEPEPYAGMDLRGVLRWARTHMPLDDYLACAILRRATALGSARLLNLDTPQHIYPAEIIQKKMLKCFAFMPERAAGVRRMSDSVIDFSERPEVLLADLADHDTAVTWLKGSKTS